ncbi:hypothetical protein HJC23_010396 [Cyclotella cryptica]|uniref:Uncharacterized protein n=1 Tax=Cyclotella cryptica TaxID=29204 RepID=A0ABD3QJN6_9STRA
MKSTTAIATAVIVTGTLIYKRNAIFSYCNGYRGIQGFFRYIWIGDYLPPPIRKSVDELDELDELVNKCEPQLDHIETLVQRALLDSVDGPISISNEFVGSREELQKQIFQQNPELRKDIGMFSSRLDRLAARIDSVMSHSDEEVKRRKKQLSSKIVLLMTELDKIITTLCLTEND